MTDEPMYWRDKPVTELSREELLEVIAHLNRAHAKVTTPDAIRARAVGRAEMLCRGSGK